MNTLQLSIRQRKLLHIVQNQTTFITGNDLAKELEVSPRTIRNDISEINIKLKPLNAKIDSEKSKGYFFSANDSKQIQKLNRIETAFFTKEDRIRYILFKLCLSNSEIDIFDLEDEMYISRTTLEHDLRYLRMKYVTSTPYIKIISNKNCISFEQDEKKIRYILNQLFFEDWDYNERGNAFYSYQFLDHSVVELIMNEIPIYFNKYNLQMEDPSLVSLNLSIAIMYHRIVRNYKLPFSKPIPKSDPIAQIATTELLNSLENKLHCSFPQEERDEIYLKIAAGHLLDASLINFKTINDFFGPITIDMLNEYLLEIKNTFNLDFTKDEDFYITLLQYFRYLQLPSQILNAQGNMNIAKQNLLIEYEIAYLFQKISIKYLNYYIDEIKLLYLAHCISGALEYMYHNNPTSKFKTVIACQMNLPAIWSLKRKVLGAFTNYLNITALLPVNAKSAYDFSDTDLIITTVTKQLTENPNTDTIQISGFMTPSDYRNIETYIQNKRISRLYPNSKNSIKEMFQNAFWHENIDLSTPFNVIEYLSNDFISNDFVDEQFLNDILRRESLSSFAIKPNIVLVHSLVPSTKTKLSICNLDQRIIWDTQKIKVVIMVSFAPEDMALLFQLLHLIYDNNFESANFKNQMTKTELLSAIFQ